MYEGTDSVWSMSVSMISRCQWTCVTRLVDRPRPWLGIDQGIGRMYLGTESALMVQNQLRPCDNEPLISGAFWCSEGCDVHDAAYRAVVVSGEALLHCLMRCWRITQAPVDIDFSSISGDGSYFFKPRRKPLTSFSIQRNQY